MPLYNLLWKPTLVQAVVRDLAWVAASPWLMQPNCNRWLELRAPEPFSQVTPEWLAALDADPQPLLNHLQNSHTQRLGSYYEALWLFLLQQDPSKTLLHHNLQVQQAQRTLGEFDVIYHCHVRDRIVHLELAVKFYLGLTAPLTRNDGWDRWLGPGCRDTLDLKVNKLLNKQLRLALTPEGQATLTALGITEVEPAWAVQGYLFYPDAVPCPFPHDTYPDHLHGRWLTLERWLRHEPIDKAASRWQVLHKPHWLAPQLSAADDSRLLPWNALNTNLQTHFRHHRMPQQVARLTPTSDGYWLERERLFITGNHWPENRPNSTR